MEGLSGKNPAYHAGKIYSAAAWEIAQKIWTKFNVACEVYIASQIDRPLDDPWTITINLEKPLDGAGVKNIVLEVLGNTKAITERFLKGEIPLS
jgi:S-adenosylmethionine synthetase